MTPATVQCKAPQDHLATQDCRVQRETLSVAPLVPRAHPGLQGLATTADRETPAFQGLPDHQGPLHYQGPTDQTTPSVFLDLLAHPVPLDTLATPQG